MNPFRTTPSPLWGHPRFKRLMVYSAAGHITVAGVVLFAPGSYSSTQPTPIFVTVAASVPRTAAPAPPPKQNVEEAIVIPPVPRPKPAPRKPKPEPEPPKPEPPKPEPAPEPELSAEEIMEQLRQDYDSEVPDRAPEGQAGIVDPEMAVYQAKLQGCVLRNWVGAQRFYRRQDLYATFDIEISPDGTVIAVEKTRGSGERIVDETAERAIYRCSPLPLPPGGERIVAVRMSPGDKR